MIFAHIFQGRSIRLLALALRGLRIDETEESGENTTIEELEYFEFGQEGNAEAYLLDGWHAAEKDHRWSSMWAELRCKTTENRGYYLKLHYAYYAASGNTNIYVNDTLLTTLDGKEPIVKIEIRPEVLHKDGNQVISFETSNAISPNETGDNFDDRILGICIYTLDLNPIELE